MVVDETGAIGTNGYVARMIQSAVGGDIHVIQAAEPYPADFDGVVEQNHQEDSRALSSRVENIERYDAVFIGYPAWATTLPQTVRAFLSEYDFTGKTVIPFCTHDGYGAGSSFTTASELAAGAETLEGIAIEVEDVPVAQDTVAQWLEDLGLSESRTDSQDEIPICITVGEARLDGVLYDTAEAQQFLALLPQAISMTNYGGREVYVGLDGTIMVEGDGQLWFDNGDITYCPSNNTAAIFYAQTDCPNLTMEVIPWGGSHPIWRCSTLWTAALPLPSPERTKEEPSMKRVWSFLLALAMALSLVACGNDNGSQSSTPAPPAPHRRRCNPPQRRTPTSRRSLRNYPPGMRALEA